MRTLKRGLSLFSGVGGFDLVADSAGISPVAFCEIDPFCRLILKKNWPTVPVYENVFDLRGDQVGQVDIIYGGFPSQPFSVAGRQRGQEDERYLWDECARLVGEIKPRWVFFENVPGIIKIAGDAVCEDLERLGYEVGIWNFEGAAIGANHRRARIAFVAHSRREQHERGVVGGKVENEDRERVADINQRSSSAPGFVPDSKSEQGGGHIIGGVLPYIGAGSEAVPDACGERREEQRGCVTNEEKYASIECSSEDVSNSNVDDSDSRRTESAGQLGESRVADGGDVYENGSSRRSAKPRLGGVDDGVPAWLDRDWWRIEPDIPRVAKGVKDRVNRLKALGNAVVPAWAFPIFKAIIEADKRG